MAVLVVGPREPSVEGAVNTTSRSSTWSRGLSPFFLGPVKCYGGLEAKNVENAWQYSKVYQSHVDANNDPTQAWFDWRDGGFAKSYADRYPMGKGAIPLYSWWDMKKYTYIQARQEIYIPLYAAAVRQNAAFWKLKKLYETMKNVTLWDFDGYDHRKLGMTYEDVILSETKKMGHGFVLAMMLEGLI